MKISITQAKAIPLQKLVELWGGRYSHTDRKGDHWYFSPFRPEESTASFKINEETNTWHDFGLSKTFAHHMQGCGGDVVDLWCDFNFKDRRLGISDALTALAQFLPALHEQVSKLIPARKPQQSVRFNLPPRYEIADIADKITYAGLKNELSRRRIPIQLAHLYLKQGHILDIVTNKKYIGFLFENDKGGYELSIPNPVRNISFKTSIGAKGSTRILSKSLKTDTADVFEGFWDFLTWLEVNARQQPNHHSYILNSTSFVAETCQKIIAFQEMVKYAFLFMDNDEAGYQATHAIAAKLESEGFEIRTMEHRYKGFKDLSDCWMKNPQDPQNFNQSGNTGNNGQSFDI